MALPYHLSEQHNEIKTLLNNFYLFLQEGNPKLVYALLSPNLQQVSLMKRYLEKYQSVLTFRRIVVNVILFKLAEIKEGVLEGIVVVSLLSSEANATCKTIDFKQQDLRYRALKMQFIYIGVGWCIDDITPYDEFWRKE